MLGCGLPRGRQVGVAAYEAARAMAELNLRLGHDVVIDAVSDSDAPRQTWRNAASATGGDLRFVHLVISDPEEHRRRLLDRDRGFVNVPEPEWQDVQLRSAEYAPWVDEHLEVDTSTTRADDIVASMIARFAST